jgi:uncharacterized surface protein with fasciclin (FAS1) repeats
MKKSTHALAVTALAALTLPLGVAGAQAQTASSTTTTTSPSKVAAVAPTKRLVTSSNASFQKANRSTEPASNSEMPASTAWEVVSTDSDLSEFAAIVKAAGLEDLYSKAGISTFIVPTNAAFIVLDQDQVARLKDSKFKEQAANVVRHHIANGTVNLGDFTRRLPTGLPPAPPTTIQNCTVTGGVIVNSVQTGGRLACTSVAITAPVPPPAVSALTMLSGKTIPVQTSTVRDPAGGANHYRVAVANGGFLETADFAVKNGVLHTIDTLQIPTGTLTDVVGRR